MPHVYIDVHKLEGKPLIGNGNCVALVQNMCNSALLLAVVAPAGAAPLALECPAKYPDLVQMRAMASRGWLAPVPGAPNSPLVQVGVSVGPAERNGELIGAPLRNGTGYRFEYDVFNEDLEKWVFCEYRMSSGYARVMYRISGGRACETRIRPARGTLGAASISCE